jgi:hypothetical protein
MDGAAHISNSLRKILGYLRAAANAAPRAFYIGVDNQCVNIKRSFNRIACIERVKDFVSITERESAWHRLKGTIGWNVKHDADGR